jgi:putative flippase GtrA
LWNFGLTEAWVYGSKSASEGRLKRLSLFFVMNLAALALRAPVIYLMTTGLGIYYVISNAVSLVILTALRFVLADNIIWSKPSAAKTRNLTKFDIGDAQ